MKLWGLGINKMEKKLKATNKYEFLMSSMPKFEVKDWFEVLPRAGRIPIAMMFLAQHRMIIETGRWRIWKRTEYP